MCWVVIVFSSDVTHGLEKNPESKLVWLCLNQVCNQYL